MGAIVLDMLGIQGSRDNDSPPLLWGKLNIHTADVCGAKKHDWVNVREKWKKDR
jgi:hypothetical protein